MRALHLFIGFLYENLVLCRSPGIVRFFHFFIVRQWSLVEGSIEEARLNPEAERKEEENLNKENKIDILKGKLEHIWRALPRKFKTYTSYIFVIFISIPIHSMFLYLEFSIVSETKYETYRSALVIVWIIFGHVAGKFGRTNFMYTNITIFKT